MIKFLLLFELAMSFLSLAGASGRIIDVTSNYFALSTKTEWRLIHYNVQFEPDEERAHVRRALMREHKDVIGANIFDGASMFCSRLLPGVNHYSNFFYKNI